MLICYVDVKLCIISTALDATEGIFAVLYVSIPIMGLTRFYKTTVFFTFIKYRIVNSKTASQSL